MSIEILSALAAVGTFVVLGAAAVAALIQLRHLRAQNQLAALVSIGQTVVQPMFLNVETIVDRDLARKLEDPDYRRALDSGTVNLEICPELIMPIWYEQIGVFLKKGLVTEDVLLEWNAPVYLRYWGKLSGLIAIMRRQRPTLFENFEYLAARAQRWLERHPHGTFPHSTPRMPLHDRWSEIDAITKT